MTVTCPCVGHVTCTCVGHVTVTCTCVGHVTCHLSLCWSCDCHLSLCWSCHLSLCWSCDTCVQVRELEGVLGGSGGDSQIIWTSSQNAKKEAFSLDDIQHEHGWVVSGLNTLNVIWFLLSTARYHNHTSVQTNRSAINYNLFVVSQSMKFDHTVTNETHQ